MFYFKIIISILQFESEKNKGKSREDHFYLKSQALQGYQHQGEWMNVTAESELVKK